jgi:hypothetical protein
MYLGLALVFGLLTAGLQAIRMLSEACAIVSVICIVGCFLSFFKREARTYDLVTLREIHEREMVKNIEVEEPAEFDSVHCLNCGEIYNMRMPLCPVCKAVQGQGPCC